MTSKEKYLAKIASKESKAVIDAKERLKNEKWLKESKRLALRILLRLDELKLTQKNFAKKLEVSPQYVNKLLKGNEKFGFDILIKIQEELKMPILYGTDKIEKANSNITQKKSVVLKQIMMSPNNTKKVMGKVIQLNTFTHSNVSQG
ncbi:helix-turn-helix domain-containing protein [Empedobacter brevis]